MPDFDPRSLAEWSGGTWRGTPPGRITGFSIDSRTLRPGQLFVAIATASRDGHAYLAAAEEKGAPCALVARFDPAAGMAQLVVADPARALRAIARSHRQSFPGPVVGITGSCGKTSTKDLLTEALGGRTRVGATAGNLNNLLGVPLTLLGCDPGQHRFAVIEAGISEPGEMARLASMLDPDLGMITSIGPAHLEALASVEIVAKEKAQLLAHLRPGGRALIPSDCLRWPSVRELPVAFTVVGPEASIGPGVLPEGASFIPYQAVRAAEGLRVTVRFPGEAPVVFQLASTSLGMASNAVLALAAAVALGEGAGAAAGGLERWRPSALRGEIFERTGRLIYLDCYNANPSSMLDSVHAFVARAGTGAPRLYLVGSMEELGPESAEWHHWVGRQWPRGRGDRFVLVGDQGAAFRRGLLEAGHDAGSVTVNPVSDDLSSLIERWPGAVFVKGSRRHRLEERMGSAWRQAVETEAAC